MNSERLARPLRVGALALLWGSSFLWIKVALVGMSPVQIVLGRLALGAAVLYIAVRISGLTLPRNRAVWGHLVIAALVSNAVPYFLFALGEQTVSSSFAGVVNATTPLWTIVIAYVARQESRPSPTRLTGFVLGFCGVLLALAPWDTRLGEGALTGGIACLGAAISYGISYVYIGRFLTPTGMPTLVLSAGQMIAATLLLILITPVAGLDSMTLTFPVIGSMLILGALGTGAAYVLNYKIIADDGPTAASTVSYLLPLVAVTLGWAVLSERVDTAFALGSLMVLFGVGLARRREHSTPRTSAR